MYFCLSVRERDKRQRDEWNEGQGAYGSYLERMPTVGRYAIQTIY